MATPDNLKIAQQLLATMQQISQQLETQTGTYKAQVDLVDAICKAQECFGNIDPNKINEITKSLEAAQRRTGDFGKAVQESEEQVGVLGKAVEALRDKVNKLSVPEEFLNGFKAGINVSNNFLKGILTYAGPVITFLKDLGMLLLSLPGRLIDFFANAAEGGIDPYRQALEELREEFGNLKIGTSAAVISMTENMKDLGESGLQLGRVFGYGREGLAAILKENMEVAKEMGPVFDQFSASLGDAIVDFTILRKSANLTAESFKSIYLSAQDAGKTTGEAIREMSRDIAKAERAFGISAKLYGKDMNFMIKETQTFGIVGTKEMLKVSTYARKLGLSIEALKNIMDSSLTFEDAAQQAAKLAESFNITVGAFELFNARDVTKKLDMIRDGFFKTGRNIEQLDILERKQLSEITKLSDEQLRLAFSQKSRALTGAQLEAQMKKSQKTEISQAEAMKQLAESIKRLIQSGNPMKGGFFNVFMNGFNYGIKRTKEFRDVVRALQRSFRVVYYAGRQVGRMFIKLFPGVKQMLVALKDLFSPSRFRDLMKKVVGEFRSFFKLLQTDPRAGFEQFMKNMKKIFFDFFNKGAPAGSKFLDGLKQFWKTILIVMVQGVKAGLTAIKDVLKYLIEVVKNPELLTEATGTLGSDIVDSFSSMFAYLKTELAPVFLEAAGALWELITLMTSKLYKTYIEPNLGKILLAYFAPAIVAGVVRGGLVVLAQSFMGMASRISKGGSMIQEGLTRTTTVTGKDGTTTVTQESMAKQSNKMADIKGEFLRLAATLAALVIAIGIAVAAIIVLAKMYESSGIKKESFVVVGLMFAGIAIIASAITASGLLTSLREVGATANKETLVGLGVLALVMAGITLTLWAIVGISKGPDVSAEKLEAIAKLLGVVTLVFLAAIPLVFAAGVIGALVVSTFGIGAAAAVAGMATLASVVLTIAETTRQIAKQFKNISPAQAEAAAKSVEAVTNLFSVVAGMLTSLLDHEKETNNAGTAGRVVQALTGLVHQVGDRAVKVLEAVNVAGDINTMKAKAELVGAVLGGMAGIITPLANFSKSYNENSMNLKPDTIEKFGTVVSNILDKLKVAVESILRELTTLIGRITNIDIIKAAGAAIGGILTAISALLAGIMSILDGGATTSSVMGGVAAGAATGALIGSFFPVVGTAAGALIGAVVGGIAAFAIGSDAFQKKIDAMIRIFGAVSDKISDLVRGVTSALSGVTTLQNLSDQNVKAAEVVGQVMASVAQVVSAVFSVSQIFKDKDFTGPQIEAIIGKFKDLLTGVMPLISALMVEVRNFAVAFLNAVIGLSLNPTQTKAMESVSSIIGVVGNVISSITSAVASIVAKATGSAADIERILLRGGALIRAALQDIPSFLQNLTTNIQPLLNSVSNVIVPTGVNSKIKTIKALFEIIPAIASVYTSFVDLGKEMREGGSQFFVGVTDITPERVIARLKDSITTIMQFISDRSTGIGPSFPDLIQNLIRNIDNLSFGRNISDFVAKVKALKTAFEAIKSIIDVVGVIKGLQVEGGAAATPLRADILNTPLVSLRNVLNSLGSNKINDRGTDYDNPLKDMTLFMPVVAINQVLARNAIPRLLTSVKDKLVSIFQSSDSIIDAARSFGATQINTGEINTALSNFSQLLTTITQAQVPIRSGGTVANPLLDSSGYIEELTSVDSVLRQIAPKLERIGTNMRRIADVNIGAVHSERIRTMVEAYNSFSVELSRLDTASGNTGPIDVALRRLGTRLQGARVATIRNAAVNAQINVTVRMEAGQVVEALHTHAVQRNQSVGSGTTGRRAFNVSQAFVGTEPGDIS